MIHDPYKELLQGKDLEEFQDDMLNNKWLETEKSQWIHEIYSDLRNRKKTDHDPTPEMIHFLTEHGLFAAKLVQMNLKNSDKCTCSSKQRTIREASLGVMPKK